MPNQEHKAAHPEAVILSEVHTQFIHEFGDWSGSAVEEAESLDTET